MNQILRCRMVACRESPESGSAWTFYFINDSEFALDAVVVGEVQMEWGDWGASDATGHRIENLEPGAHAMAWRDNGDGVEFRMDFSVSVDVGSVSTKLCFEFPKLYRKKDLPLIEDLGRPGWQEALEAPVGSE